MRTYDVFVGLRAPCAPVGLARPTHSSSLTSEVTDSPKVANHHSLRASKPHLLQLDSDDGGVRALPAGHAPPLERTFL